eukprot:scaffold217597_cov54-Prasinocladus_malaysianus.AAC.1
MHCEAFAVAAAAILQHAVTAHMSWLRFFAAHQGTAQSDTIHRAKSLSVATTILDMLNYFNVPPASRVSMAGSFFFEHSACVLPPHQGLGGPTIIAYSIDLTYMYG